MKSYNLMILGLGLVVFAASCAGSGSGSGSGSGIRHPVALPLGQASGLCNLDSELCASAPFYDDAEADRLILSPDMLAEGRFDAGTGSDVTALLANPIDDLPLEDLRFEIGLTLAGTDVPLDAGRISEVFQVYCAASGCAENVAVGYNYYVRTPRTVANTENNLLMTRFTVLKTTLNGDAMAFGVVASMDYQGQVPSPAGGGATFERYLPVQTGGFVSGARFAAELPASGRAAYVGFANAYAQSSNLNFAPFRAFRSHDGANMGAGHAVMVFNFAGGEANFEHGYLDLFGPAFTDEGDDDEQAISSNSNNFVLALAGRFANPEYLEPELATARPSVDDIYSDESHFDERRSADYLDTETGEYYIGRGGDSAVAASGLAFRLAGNDNTAEKLDFTMELVGVIRDPSSRSQVPNCYPADPNVACYFSADSPTGAGLLRLYGSQAELSNNDELNDQAPTFAGGIWQYNRIFYVDRKDTHDDPTDDELLGIVDLIGSIGGAIYDADPD